MKRLKTMVPALLIMALSFNSCILDFGGDGDGIGTNCVRGSGSSVTEVLNINEFDGIDLQVSADVYITQGPVFEVRAEGQANIIEELELDVRNGFWEIEFDRCIRNMDDFRIYITMPDIRELHISGSGNIYGENVFITDDLDLRISGSGDMDLALDSDDINASVTGSGDLRLEGVADDLVLRISGSGDLYGFNFECDSAEIEIVGSGDAEIFVNSRLDVRITGSGDVFYKGNPSIDKRTTGSGRVIDAN